MRLILCLAFVFTASASHSDEFRILGRAKLFSNDYLGDGMDRWRSGSYSRSLLFGESWDGGKPGQRVYELRFRGELIAPSDTSQEPAEGERPFVGLVALGGARHLRFRETDVRLGGELVVTGPQTGMSRFVRYAHSILGFEEPRATRNQLGNNLIPTASLEASRTLRRNTVLPFEIRPFVEAQVGSESYLRAGADAFFGQGMAGNLVTRDVVTGHIMTAVSMKMLAGLTPTLGIDVTRVFNTYYLPPSSGLSFHEWRIRVRGGLRSQTEARDVFMGLSWLSPEYQGQPHGQVLGSMSVDHKY